MEGLVFLSGPLYSRGILSDKAVMMKIVELLAARYGVTVSDVIRSIHYMAGLSGQQRKFAVWSMRQSNRG